MFYNSLQGSVKILILMMLVFVLTGCVSTQKKHDLQLPVTPARRPVSEIVKTDVTYTIDAYDPWENFNRRMYSFNYYFDKYFYLPLVGVYETITPDFLEDHVSNVFNNIGEFKNLTNAIFQLDGDSSGKTLGRVVANSTIGIGGLFDMATEMGIPRQNEDFGQTLGHYGAGSGPYLVLPVLGPSSLRDTAGLVMDTALRTAAYSRLDLFENAQDKDAIEAGLFVLEAIDKRHLESFRYYETGSPFEYDLIRFLYLKKRELDIVKKTVQIEAPFIPQDLSGKMNSGEYEQKMDNFLLIFDASSSMAAIYQNDTKFKQAKRLAGNFNRTIPFLKLQAGLLAFGSSKLGVDSKLSYGMTAHVPLDFADQLDSILSTGGVTPLARSLNVAGKTLAGIKGKTAVIIFSDGEKVGEEAVQAAEDLKNQYKQDICIYTVLFGNGQGGKALMSQMVDTGRCGFATSATTLSSAGGMADFVEAVFLKKIPDTD